MNSMKILKQAVDLIVIRGHHNKAVKMVRAHFEGSKLEAGFNKKVARKRLEELIALGTGERELEMEPVDLLHLGMGEKRKVKRFSDAMIKSLENIIKMMDHVEVGGCDHSNAKVIPLLYGGGFTPMMSRPELVCPDCGLNVTLDRKSVVEAGLSIDYIRDLYEWSRIQKGVLSSNDVVTQPRETLEKSKQYEGDMEPIFAVIRKLEPFSGQ